MAMIIEDDASFDNIKREDNVSYGPGNAIPDFCWIARDIMNRPSRWGVVFHWPRLVDNFSPEMK